MVNWSVDNSEISSNRELRLGNLETLTGIDINTYVKKVCGSSA